jgi:superfamily II DNA/RNA helicase
MLDMGFIEDIEYILAKTPSNRQTSLFSATIDGTVMNLCNRYMKEPSKNTGEQRRNRAHPNETILHRRQQPQQV